MTCQAAAADPPNAYSLVTIGSSDGLAYYGEAWGINDSGAVSGAISIDVLTTHAFVYQDGHLTLLENPGIASESVGFSINDLGVVVGSSTGPGRTFATKWHADGSVEVLDQWDSQYSEATGINNNGQIAGRANDPNFDNHERAVLWDRGQEIDLGTLTGQNTSLAWEINDAGTICGVSSGSPGNIRNAVSWTGGNISQLNWPINNLTYAHGINQAGAIVGFAPNLSSPGNMAGCMWYQGHEIQLAARANDRNTYARHINDAGEIIGSAERHDIHSNQYVEVPVVWPTPNSNYIEFSSMWPPLTSWRRVVELQNLNNHGQIVGYGRKLTQAGWHRHAFIVSPVHPTLTLHNAVPGVAGEVNTITLDRATPGATVSFFYSFHGGGAVIPGCSLQQNSLQIDDPKLIGTDVTDENGTAQVSGFVPSVAQGHTVLIQAAISNQCEVSQLIAQQFE